MGYFSNGTEGDLYVEHYCHRCIHYREEGPDCGVMLAHLLHNYDQFREGGEHLKSALDLLIPRITMTGADGIAIPTNGECAMFLVKNLTGDLFPPAIPPAPGRGR